MPSVANSVRSLRLHVSNFARTYRPRVDIIIAEDDPYYFLQCGAYEPKAERAPTTTAAQDQDAFFASLAPSYLR